MYINDVCEAMDNLSCILFGKTSLYCLGKNLPNLIHTVENDLSIIKQWFDINKLSMNLNKTKYIIFGNKKIDCPTNVKLNDMEIKQVTATKFLGIHIDEKLESAHYCSSDKVS
ncbi:hypothetical protein NQD34_017937 [Periophthalmus magnuspinnatus]|nr:hypothetical protein NQD34_017937 [Periophthalmus magnuspinnatus]